MTDNTLRDRQDHTRGSFSISDSPFRSAQAIADALTLTARIMWHIETGHIGGNGDVTSATCLTGAIKPLWQDARGGWWIQKKLRATWLIPDFDATEQLAQNAEWMRESESSGNYTRDEVDYMRHPD